MNNVTSARDTLILARAIHDTLGEVSGSDWLDWTWQLKNAFVDPNKICAVLGLPRPQGKWREVAEEFLVRVTPYYVNSLCLAAERQGEVARVARTFLPAEQEMQSDLLETDGMGEDATHPSPVISALYPDRALLFVTNVCPVYCRYCFRKRKVGRVGQQSVGIPELDSALTEIRDNGNVRDVIISGGEPLMLSDDKLISVIERIAEIKHVGMIRIDSKFMAAFPHRFSAQLAERLVTAAGSKVLECTFHFVHPLEVTAEVKSVAWDLAAKGILMNAYTPLLRDVNDDRATLKKLFWALAMCKIRPYYLVQNVTNRWNQHFQVSIERGRRLIESLSGDLSGLALPQYIVYLPQGGGKVSLHSDRLRRDGDNWVVRSHDGREIPYYDPVGST